MKRRRYEKPVGMRTRSREYKIFLEEERQSSLPRTAYEKMARLAGSVMNIEPDAKAKKKIQDAINFSHLKIKPRDASSLTIFLLLVISIPTALLMVTSLVLGFGIPLEIGLLILMIMFPIIYYIYIYPFHLKKVYEIQAGNEMVIMILYMAMYMRNNPNMENAIRFASENMTGILSYEIRKLMWDVEVGNYTNINDALFVYAKKWEMNKEFSEAIEILVTSTKQSEKRRIDLLDEAIDIVLRGNRENAKHFNQNLKLPVMIVNALGVILPAMGMVLFPLVAIFLGVEAIMLFVGYDILLPLFIYFIINNILETRPATYSKIDISENPNIPPVGKFKYGSKILPAWPFPIVIGAAMIVPGFLLLATNEIIAGLLITGSFAFSLGTYHLLLAKGRMKVREETRRIENEFSEALFQLGNQISSGKPIEISMEHSLQRINNLKIKDLFYNALKNIKTLGFTFEQAFFDKKYGAIRFYPSRLIKSTMRTVVESTKKGVGTASVSMLSISRYLKGIHQTQEEVKEELSDTINSLKFQVYFLSPMISGIVITLAIIIIQIVSGISGAVESAGIGAGILDTFKNSNITPFEFVIVIAIYIIEVAIILSTFINGIESGDDEIGKNHLTGSALIGSFIVFVVVFLLTFMIFQPLITNVI